MDRRRGSPRFTGRPWTPSAPPPRRRTRCSGASACAPPTTSSGHLQDRVDMSLSTVVCNPVDSGSPVPTRQRLVIHRRSGRHVEKLSPGMCTGWGDPSRCRSGMPPRTRPRHVSGRDVAPDTSLTWPFSIKERTGARRPGGGAGRRAHGMGTNRGQPGEWTWTNSGRCARRSSCPRVDNRRTLTTHSGPTGLVGT